MNADTSAVITASIVALTDKNLFSYCDSNPVMRVDTSGMYWDTILDVISLCYSAYCVVQDPTDELNWGALAADVVCLALPVVAAGGVMVKATKTVATNADTPANIARGVKLVDAYNEAEKAGENVVTVGRWMSECEYNKMVKTGYVQKPYTSNQSYASYPASYDAFYKQAKVGSIYAEFDVPYSSIRKTQNGWVAIPGPDSMFSRLRVAKGKPPIESFPRAINIKVLGVK